MTHSDVWELCEEYFEWRLTEFPEFGSFCGEHAHDDELNDHSSQAFTRRLVVKKIPVLSLWHILCKQYIDSRTHMRFTHTRDLLLVHYWVAVEAFLARITELEARHCWPEDDVLNLALLKDNLLAFKNGTSNSGPKGYYFVLSYNEGIHCEFEQLTSWMHFNSEEDFRKYLLRLKALPHRDLVPEQLNAVSTGMPEESVFFAPFNKMMPVFMDSETWATMRQEAIELIMRDIQPAFAKLLAYVQQVYMKACRPREGVDSIPGGPEFYQQCLRWHTSLDLTPQEIHDIGLAEVARIRKEMEKVMQKTGYAGSFKDFVKELRADNKFYFKTQDECLEHFRHICYDVIRPVLPALFPKIPQSKLLVQPTLPGKSSSSTGYYYAGTLDGSRPGVFYINTNNLGNCIKSLPPNKAETLPDYYAAGTLDGSRPGIFYVGWKNCTTYGVRALALHEGEPGHHFQGMYAIESTHLPRFRRFMEDMYYLHAPSKFPIYTAYCEGWGLYCEYLGYELGLYEDPYDEFGFLSFEMFRACRLVADTGLHSMQWSYEQAVKLFLDNTALSEPDIRCEVRRYITWPGQACAYKLGQMKIKELRKMAEAALGAEFNVRSFHDTLLCCGLVPLSTLETVVHSYIDSERQKLTTDLTDVH